MDAEGRSWRRRSRSGLDTDKYYVPLKKIIFTFAIFSIVSFQKFRLFSTFRQNSALFSLSVKISPFFHFPSKFNRLKERFFSLLTSSVDHSSSLLSISFSKLIMNNESTLSFCSLFLSFSSFTSLSFFLSQSFFLHTTFRLFFKMYSKKWKESQQGVIGRKKYFSPRKFPFPLIFFLSLFILSLLSLFSLFLSLLGLFSQNRFSVSIPF